MYERKVFVPGLGWSSDSPVNPQWSNALSTVTADPPEWRASLDPQLIAFTLTVASLECRKCLELTCLSAAQGPVLNTPHAVFRVFHVLIPACLSRGTKTGHSSLVLLPSSSASYHALCLSYLLSSFASIPWLLLWIRLIIIVGRCCFLLVHTP